MPLVLTIPLYDKTLSEAVSHLVETCCENNLRSNRIVTATGAHGLVCAHKNLLLHDLLNSAYMNIPDGMSGVWIGKLKGAKEMDRCYGPDFFKHMMQETADKHINHYFCGGENAVAEELRSACEEKYDNFNVVGTFSPPFREMTDEELAQLAKQINEVKADIVWIGLSTPKQEIFASRLSKYTNVHFLCTVGAAFDFHTGKVKQAPQWIQKMGMEWFFRLLTEPKRLWRRYVEIVPLFIWYNFIELVKGDFFINRGER